MDAIKRLNYNKIDFSKLRDRINSEMARKSMTYVKLAKAAHASPESVRCICLGYNSNPTIKTIEAIAYALDLDVFELLGSYDAVSTIEEKNIPVYSFNTLANINNETSAFDTMNLMVKGSDACFALTVDISLAHILVSANSMVVDEGDVLIFDKKNMTLKKSEIAL